MAADDKELWQHSEQTDEELRAVSMQCQLLTSPMSTGNGPSSMQAHLAYLHAREVGLEW